MDPKKVASLIPLDENGDPFLFEEDGVTPLKFHAEFNDAVFDGTISAMTGTFSGKLTAQAIDAAGNISIRGEAVAKTVTASRSVLTVGAGSGKASVVDLGILVDAGDTGIVVVMVQYWADAFGIPWTKDSNGVITYYDQCWLYLYNNDQQVYASGARRWKQEADNAPSLLEAFVPVTAGYNNISFKIKADFNYLTVRNVVAKCDYIRKV